MTSRRGQTKRPSRNRGTSESKEWTGTVSVSPPSGVLLLPRVRSLVPVENRRTAPGTDVTPPGGYSSETPGEETPGGTVRRSSRRSDLLNKTSVTPST